MMPFMLLVNTVYDKHKQIADTFPEPTDLLVIRAFVFSSAINICPH